MKSIARWCFRHRWIVLAIWLVLFIGLGAVSNAFGATYKDDFNLPNTDSKKAIQLLQESFPQQSGETDQIVVHVKQGTVNDPQVTSQVTEMFGRVAKLPYVKGVSSFYDSGKRQTNISKDGTIAFADLELAVDSHTRVPVPDVKKIISTARSVNSSAVDVELAGATIESANNVGLGATEGIGLAFAAVILFIAFGSIFTMFLPLLTAVLALGTAFSVIGFLTHVYSLSSVAPSLAALIGLGVGVDYALFIVSRHRTNLQQGMSVEDAAVTAIDTSGRAVMFAGITVCIGLLGLFLLGINFLYGLGSAAVVAVLFTMFTAVTFLPAMLGFVGMKALNKKQRRALADHAGDVSHEQLSPTWYGWARFVQRHSWPLATVALVVMIVLSIPTFHIRLGSTDAGGDPKGTTTRTAYDLLAKGFGAGFNGPLQLVAQVNTPGDLTTFKNLTAQVAKQPDIAVVTPPQPSPNGKVAVSIAYPKTSPQAAQTSKLITQLRKHVIPTAEKGTQLKTYVGGQTAIFQDFSQVLSSKYPLFFGVIIGLAFILLMAVFRSLVIPLTASIMNLLAAGAGFGVVVAVFQWGWLTDVFAVDHTGPIQAFLPVLVFAILFGLSMDYEVFLVSRMHEEWIHTNDNEEAISLGQAETGRVITAAASIMVFVFGTFIFGGEPTIKLFGLGLAAAILIDAAIIRTILVPAVMHILGRSNWWLPGWLDRILPRLSVEPKESS
jgi:putative drug exporter of the RND superfamily